MKRLVNKLKIQNGNLLILGVSEDNKNKMMKIVLKLLTNKDKEYGKTLYIVPSLSSEKFSKEAYHCSQKIEEKIIFSNSLMPIDEIKYKVETSHISSVLIDYFKVIDTNKDIYFMEELKDLSRKIKKTILVVVDSDKQNLNHWDGNMNCADDIFYIRKIYKKIHIMDLKVLKSTIHRRKMPKPSNLHKYLEA